MFAVANAEYPVWGAEYCEENEVSRCEEFELGGAMLTNSLG